MSGIIKTIVIDAPPASVFGIMGDPWNAAKIWPNVLNLYDIERVSPSKWRFRWVRKLVKVHFQGLTETILFPPDHGMLSETSGGIHTLMAWALEKTVEGTLLILSVDYALPAPLFQKHSQDVVSAAFESDIGQMLANLKALVEASAHKDEHIIISRLFA